MMMINDQWCDDQWWNDDMKMMINVMMMMMIRIDDDMKMVKKPNSGKRKHTRCNAAVVWQGPTYLLFAVPRLSPTNLDVYFPCVGPHILLYKKLCHKLHNSILHCVQTSCVLLEWDRNLEIFLTGIRQLGSFRNFQILGKNSRIQYQYLSEQIM